MRCFEFQLPIAVLCISHRDKESLLARDTDSDRRRSHRDFRILGLLVATTTMLVEHEPEFG